jgi:hypothetical protein
MVRYIGGYNVECTPMIGQIGLGESGIRLKLLPVQRGERDVICVAGGRPKTLRIHISSSQM